MGMLWIRARDMAMLVVRVVGKEGRENAGVIGDERRRKMGREVGRMFIS